MKKNHKHIRDLFLDELSDVYNAEGQIIKALPSVIKAAENEELREALQTHFEETKGQVERLDQIYEILGEKHKREKCDAMEGLIEECSKAIHEFPKSAVRDAAIISKAQRIEHYEISAYGTLCAFAKELDLEDVKSLLHQTLDEEGHADKTLTKIGEGSLLASGVNHLANR